MMSERMCCKSKLHPIFAKRNVSSSYVTRLNPDTQRNHAAAYGATIVAEKLDSKLHEEYTRKKYGGM